jgi:hypothetical protein
MTQPSKPLVPPGPLTFEELRLANLVHPHNEKPASLFHDTPLNRLNDATLAVALAEIVIQVDWMAANRGIDLMLAIRNRFAIGGDPQDVVLERK